MAFPPTCHFIAFYRNTAPFSSAPATATSSLPLALALYFHFSFSFFFSVFLHFALTGTVPPANVHN